MRRVTIGAVVLLSMAIVAEAQTRRTTTPARRPAGEYEIALGTRLAWQDTDDELMQEFGVWMHIPITHEWFIHTGLNSGSMWGDSDEVDYEQFELGVGREYWFNTSSTATVGFGLRGIASLVFQKTDLDPTADFAFEAATTLGLSDLSSTADDSIGFKFGSEIVLRGLSNKRWETSLFLGWVIM